MHLIIFSTLLTPRIKYIFNFIFKEILKAEVEFTGNKQYFLQSNKAKLSYGAAPLGDEIFFKSTSLLFGSKVDEINIKTIPFDDYSAPFPVEVSALPFDVFAASFFIVTRYEEYLHQKKSEEDFKASASLQRKWKILNRPIIDEWALILKSMIKKKYPDFKFHEKAFYHQPIINFTIVPSLPRGFINRTKFVFSTVFKKENNFLRAKFDELTGVGAKNEIIINELNAKFAEKNKPLYFIDFPLVPLKYIRKNGVSKNLKGKPVGLLRPCASDKEKLNQIKDGLTKLKKILPEQVTLISLQLEPLKFPICYLNLLNAGITSDFSMGYPNFPGFRAGTCSPFNWYDLQLEKVTPLLINAYCLTDQQLQYLPLTEARAVVSRYLNAVTAVNGSFFTLWSLKSLSPNHKYKKLAMLFNEMRSRAGN